MKGFVLDCSVTLALLLGDGDAAHISTVLDLLGQDMPVYVPPLWHYEIANCLVVARRRGQIDQPAIGRFLKKLADTSIQCPLSMPPLSKLESFTTASFASSLTAYDFAYLALARDLGAPLATFDKALRRAADRAGIGNVFA